MQTTTHMFRNYSLQKSDLTVVMSQDSVGSKRTIKDRGEDQNDDVATRAVALTRSTRIELRSMPSCKLNEYYRGSPRLMDVKRLDAMAADGKNLVIYDCSLSKHDTALSAWERRKAVLS